jgi:hypothetical protein
MSIFKKRRVSTAMLLAAFALSACSSDKNEVGSTDSVENGIFNAVSCSKFNTPTSEDATNKVSGFLGGYDFNLYWLGNSSKIDFWTNKGTNAHLMISTNSLTIDEISRSIKVTDENKEESIDTIKKSLICDESVKSAKACKKHFEKIALVLKERTEQAEKNLEELELGRLATLTCAKNFVDSRLESLELIINPPVVDPTDTASVDITPLPLPANKL